MNIFIHILNVALAIVTMLAGILMVLPLRGRMATPGFWIFKVFSAALAPYFLLASVCSLVLSFVSGPRWVVVPGSISMVIFLQHLYVVRASMKSPTGFTTAFGHNWEDRLPKSLKARSLSRPLVFRLPDVPEPRPVFDVPFGRIPGTARQILCDLWLPPNDVKRSGLAFIYCHGSAWVVLDKDFGTRPFFRQLAAQGHVIMDVAYRLFPETDMMGMVQDVYRAVSWMKRNASHFGVDPARIVLGGGSAGAHLALLAAYVKDRRFVPEELAGEELSVSGVISMYGPPDLRAHCAHGGAEYYTRPAPGVVRKAEPMPQFARKLMGLDDERLHMDNTAVMDKRPGVLAQMFGCLPDECPEIYDAFSPITYVSAGCPATLLVQGADDLITPTTSVRQLYAILNGARVPVVMYVLPHLDHAFDLVLPHISTVAHAAIYVVERFLAWRASEVQPPVQAVMDAQPDERRAQSVL